MNHTTQKAMMLGACMLLVLGVGCAGPNLSASATTAPGSGPEAVIASDLDYDATSKFEPFFFDSELLEDLGDFQVAIDVANSRSMITCMATQGFEVPQPSVRDIADSYKVLPLSYSSVVAFLIEQLDAQLNAESAPAASRADSPMTEAAREAMTEAWANCSKTIEIAVNPLAIESSWYGVAQLEASQQVQTDPRHAQAVAVRDQCELQLPWRFLKHDRRRDRRRCLCPREQRA